MNNRALRADILLLLTSLIWGFAFVAQRSSIESIGPFLFNGVRFALGSLSLLPLIFIFNRKSKAPTRSKSGMVFWGTLAAGGALFLGASLQQVGILFTTAGKAGFITGLYVVLVPIFGIVLGHRTGIATWIGALFAVVGLFFLSTGGKIQNINPGDLLVAVSALFWTAHVLLIDRLSKKIDPLILSAGQFAWCALLSLGVAGASEPIQWSSIVAALVPILYGGLASVGIAYTLQVVAQKDAPPAHSAVILCLEGVFATLGGILILREPLGAHNLLGSLLMLTGMLATQWDVIVGKRRS